MARAPVFSENVDYGKLEASLMSRDEIIRHSGTTKIFPHSLRERQL
jgi:hypothetical protein